MKRVFGVMIVLLLAVSFLAACEVAPAEFTLSGVTVSPSAPVVNDTVTISATVTNVGEESGDCNVSLTIGDYTDSKSVTLAGGASTPVSFSYTAAVEGSYTVTVSTPDDSETRTLTVTEEAPPGAPVWYVDDNWVYTCSYVDAEGTSYEDVELNVTMVAEVPAGTEEGITEDSYKLSAVFVPEATRVAADLPLTLHVGTAGVWNSKAHMEYLKQSSAIAELPGIPSSVTWTYVGDYGWPFTEGKTWSSAVRTVAGTIIDETVDRESKVLGVETITVPAGTFECYHIVSYDPASPDTYTSESWFNATVVKSNVREIDRSTWSGAETRVLKSYSVS
ncbi:hypothetical protein ES706_04671 [subsurface metagenome]